MTIRKRAGSVALGLVAVVLMGRFPLEAQEPAASKSDASTPTKNTRARRVPAYFGQISLSAEQRASIYEIQAKRIEKIEALEKQLAAEKAEMLAACEGVLNETQKKMLENLRKAAAAKSSASAKPVEAPKPSN